MIGGLSRTATNALRQLLDAGTFSNMPAGFKQRGIRVRDEAQSIQPGEFRDVDAPGGNIRDAFMPLPFKEPSATLLQLMGIVVQAGQRFAAIADMQVGDGNQQAAVGTTIALLERGSRVMSAIHKRLYVALKQEFTLFAEVFKKLIYHQNILMMLWVDKEILKLQTLMIRLIFYLLQIQIYFHNHKELLWLKQSYNLQCQIHKCIIYTKRTEICTLRLV